MLFIHIHVLYSLLSSGSCTPSRFQNPPQSLVLKEGQASSVPGSIMASAPDPSLRADRPMTSRPPTAADNSEYMLLDPNQVHQAHYTLIALLLFLPLKEPVFPPFIHPVLLSCSLSLSDT